MARLAYGAQQSGGTPGDSGAGARAGARLGARPEGPSWEAARNMALSERDGEITLVVAARGGDRDAFAMLYRRYGRMVHGLLLARVPRREVEDLVQEVFLAALRRLDSLRDPERFGGWLAMIARNRATDYHRRAREVVELPEDLAGGVNDDEQEALAVLATLRALPDAYRETLVLRLVEGMTGPEIAARTGMTEGSVRVNLHRGMKLLREKLGVGTDA